MAYDVACSCGHVFRVSDDLAGTAITCVCGRTLRVPSSRETPGPADAAPGLPRGRTAEFYRTLLELTPRAYVTPALIAVNVLVFVLMIGSGVHLTEPTVADLVRWGANAGPLTLHGEWWRLFTCVFVHVGGVHILLNMWVLYAAGPLVERMVGNIGFLLMYLVAGLCGSVASLWWNPARVSAGASGAIFGIFRALLGFLLLQRGSIPPRALAQLRSSGLSFLVYNLIFGMMLPNIDSAAHLGGLVGGFLCGLALSQPITLAARAQRPVRNVLVVVLGVVLVVGGMVAVYVRHADRLKGS